MRTKSLFHFTKSKDVLYQILDKGFWPRCSFEDVKWVTGSDAYAGFPMVCFCDIALSKLTAHTDFYGGYGIGMTKEWGIKNGLNPLMYVSTDSDIASNLRYILSNPSPELEDSRNVCRSILGYTKPLTGRMKNRVKKNGEEERDFYEECEWRYIDERSEAGVIVDPDAHTNQDGSVEEMNAKTKPNSLGFEPEDIRYLLVKQGSDVIDLVDYIHKFDLCTANQLKLLTTKIIVLEDLNGDI